MIEEWKDVQGFEGLYQVSNLGRFFGIKRNIILTPQLKGNYYQVALSINGGKRWLSVHRLVALNFIPNKENKPQVNHIDGNTKNNKVDNLEWVTSYENMQHAELNNLIPTHGRETPIKVFDTTTSETFYFINCRHASRYFNKNQTFFSNMLTQTVNNDYIIEKVANNLNEYYTII